MRKIQLVSSTRMMVVVAVLSFAWIGLLMACDGTNSGCGIDPDPTDPIVDTQTMVPHASWTCGMAQGIPAPENGELVFEVTFKLGQIYDMGQTQYGHRHLIEINGGTLSGPHISAQILEGGLDWQLTLPNGSMEVDQVMVLKTSDNKNIYFRNCGTAADQSDVRIVPDFEAPNSSDYDWLNTGTFAGVRELDMAKKTMRMRVYDVSNITIAPNAANAIRVTEPAGVTDQSWECREASASERQGNVLYTETVNIGGSVVVGNSKHGTRNVIPITGGRATGDIAGTVLSGGADYQLLSGGTFALDARYTIRTNDGELIIVRNCGPSTSLVPVFETRKDGPYAYLNNQLWLSSSPGIGLGSVNLTIYESR
jgi:hypothetical protein